jgi:hypothetical protein
MCVVCCEQMTLKGAREVEDRCGLNVHGTRIRAKIQSVATGTAHKLNLDESAENSQRASGAACMARNVINDHCELEIGLKRTI